MGTGPGKVPVGTEHVLLGRNSGKKREKGLCYAQCSRKTFLFTYECIFKVSFNFDCLPWPSYLPNIISSALNSFCSSLSHTNSKKKMPIDIKMALNSKKLIQMIH